jgi:hypothetical protein
MTTARPTSRWPSALAWAHAVLFGAIALACYVSPETLFGASAWLQLPRVAVQFLGAALVACTVVLVGSARSESPQHIRLVLLAAVVVDAQVPILSFSQPAALEHFGSGLGVPWFIVPLLFTAMVGVTVPLLTRRPGHT